MPRCGEVIRYRSAMVTSYRTVDEFLAGQTDVRRAEINALREIVLGTNPDLVEHIKWNSPSYVFDGEDRVTVNAHGKAVNLILHAGPSIVEDKTAAPTFDGGATGLLKWHSNIRASMSFDSLDEITLQRQAIADIVGRWLATTV